MSSQCKTSVVMRKNTKGEDVPVVVNTEDMKKDDVLEKDYKAPRASKSANKTGKV